REVLVDEITGDVLDRSERALSHEIAQQARLRQHRDVGWVAALDARAEHGRDVVAGRDERDGRSRLLLDQVEHGLERRLLVATCAPRRCGLAALSREVGCFGGVSAPGLFGATGCRAVATVV